MFKATNSCNIVGADNKTVWDTVIIGREKSFLLFTQDQAKIDKHIKNFEKLNTELTE